MAVLYSDQLLKLASAGKGIGVDLTRNLNQVTTDDDDDWFFDEEEPEENFELSDDLLLEDFESEIAEELAKDTDVAATKKIGENAAESVAEGMNESKGEVDAAASNLVADIPDVMGDVLNMHSPSPDIIAQFKNGVGDAVVLALKASIPDVMAAAERLSLVIPDELRKGLEELKKVNLNDYLSEADA